MFITYIEIDIECIPHLEVYFLSLVNFLNFLNLKIVLRNVTL